MIEDAFTNPKMNLAEPQGPVEWILQQLIGSDGQELAVNQLHFNADLRFEKAVTCGTRRNNQSRILNKGGGETLRRFAGEFHGPKYAFELSITEETIAGDPQSGGLRSLSGRLAGCFRQSRATKQEPNRCRRYLE